MAKRKSPKGKKIKRTVTFKLTDADFAAKGKEAAECARQVTALENEFEGVKEDWKAKIKNAEAKRDVALEAIRKGTEQRETDVTEVKNFTTQMVEYYLDGKKVDERKMEEPDMQQELKLKSRKRKGKEAKADKTEKTEAKSNVTPISEDVGHVIRSETSMKSKFSSVDGPRA
jgi:hypothetical protein